MWRDARVIGLRHGGDFLGLHDASSIANIWLDDVGRLRLKDFAKAMAGIDTLADRDRDLDFTGNPFQCFDIKRIGRFLDPDNVELLEPTP